MGLFSSSKKKTESSLPHGDYKAKVISINSRKGGVGKTTISLNIAAALSRYFSKKVLLLDLDPQAHILKSANRIIDNGSTEAFSDLILQKKRDVHEISIATNIDNFFMVQSDPGLNKTDDLLNTKIGKEFTLRSAIKVARTHYDYIIIDTPPNLGNLSINALLASDFCIIPMDFSMLAFKGVTDIIDTIGQIEDTLNHTVEILGLAINKYDRRMTKNNNDINEMLDENYKSLVLDTWIPSSTLIPQSQKEGLPLVIFNASSPVSKAIIELSGEIIERADIE